MPNRPELEGKHSDLPEDAELYGLGLEDDSKLGRQSSLPVCCRWWP